MKLLSILLDRILSTVLGLQNLRLDMHKFHMKFNSKFYDLTKAERFYVCQLTKLESILSPHFVMPRRICN